MPAPISDPRSPSSYRWDPTGAQQFALRCRRHPGIGSTSGHSADGGAAVLGGRRLGFDVSYPFDLFCLLKISIFYLYGIHPQKASYTGVLFGL